MVTFVSGASSTGARDGRNGSINPNFDFNESSKSQKWPRQLKFEHNGSSESQETVRVRLISNTTKARTAENGHM